MKELFTLQQKLNAPKDKYNKFGNYNYRSCEGILEALKPLLGEVNCTLILNDEIEAIGNRIYVKATAKLINDKGESESTTAYAREEETKKGMDGSQITGAASSYARKYALNGLFCIDDNRDSDATNTHGKDEKPVNFEAEVSKCKTREEVNDLWNKAKACKPELLQSGTSFYQKVQERLSQIAGKAKVSA